MSDLRTTCEIGFSEQPYLDWSNGDDLEVDDSLETVVIVSLFTDRRAHDDDVVEDRRGWWSDNTFGSRLYLLQPGVMNQDTVHRAHDYCVEALAWMLDKKLVSKIEVRAGWVDVNGNIVNPERGEVMPGVLGVTVTLRSPSGDVMTYEHKNVWEGFNAIQ